MEHLILKVLNFDVAVPTSNQFLKRFLKAACADKKTEFLAQVHTRLFVFVVHLYVTKLNFKEVAKHR